MVNDDIQIVTTSKCAQELFLAQDVHETMSGAHVISHRWRQHSKLIIAGVFSTFSSFRPVAKYLGRGMKLALDLDKLFSFMNDISGLYKKIHWFLLV
jgi:hypothetical protein